MRLIDHFDYSPFAVAQSATIADSAATCRVRHFQQADDWYSRTNSIAPMRLGITSVM
jgi:hypothetical protein